MAKLGAPQAGEIGRLRLFEPTFVERMEFQGLTLPVSKREQVRSRRTICTSSTPCAVKSPAYSALQNIKLLQRATRQCFYTTKTLSGPSARG